MIPLYCVSPMNEGLSNCGGGHTSHQCCIAIHLQRTHTVLTFGAPGTRGHPLTVSSEVYKITSIIGGPHKKAAFSLFPSLPFPLLSSRSQLHPSFYFILRHYPLTNAFQKEERRKTFGVVI